MYLRLATMRLIRTTAVGKNHSRRCLQMRTESYTWSEFGEKSTDKQRLKRFVDGKEFALRVIYVKSEMAATLHAKLMTNTNRDPNITCATNGIFRRAVGQHYTSKFVDDGTEDSSKYIYKADKTLLDNFDDDYWKLAWFHLLLPR